MTLAGRSAGKAVTSKDVALRAEVSLMTVSRVFSPRSGFPIAEATRERVRRAATELGYNPNRLARALVTGRTQIVTLHVPELSVYYTEVVRSVQALLHREHYEMIMLIDTFRPEEPEAALPERRAFPSDGLLAVDLSGRMAADLRRQNSGANAKPLVIIGGDPQEGLDFVGADVYAGVVEAMRHLVAAGARRIGFVAWEFANASWDARRAGFDAVVREAGIEPSFYPVSWPSREAARLEMPALLAQGPLPDAFFCFNDELAVGTFSVLRDRGVRVPEDVLLCGCDGVGDTEFLMTPLTTIRMPIAEMCSRAWSFLRERMETPGLAPQRAVLPSHLIVRQSTQTSAP